MTDISPIRALGGINYLSLGGSKPGAGKLTDLTPLSGMTMLTLYCYETPLTNLAPLKTCSKLNKLTLKGTNVTAVSVAELQQALPECKIEWDDPTQSQPK